MPQVTIIDSRQVPALDPERRGRFDRVLTVKWEGVARPSFTVTLPDERATGENIQAAIKAEVARIGGHVGQTLTF